MLQNRNVFFYHVKSLDNKKEPDWIATFDGKKTASASRAKVAAVATSRVGLDSTAFVTAGIDLPIIGFDYPRTPIVKVDSNIPPETRGGRTFQVGQILSGSDFGVVPPGFSYETAIIERDTQGRLISCGIAIKGVNVNMWRFENYQRYGSLWVPRIVRHEKGYIVGKPNMKPQTASSPSQAQNLSSGNVSIKRDYSSRFELRSASVK